MGYNKAEDEKNQKTSYWFKQEILVSWVTVFISLILVYPALQRKNPFKDFDFTYHIFPLLLIFCASLVIAFLFSLTQITKYTLKEKKSELNQNFKKVISVAVITIVVSFILLTEQMNYFGSDLIHPPEDIDFLGRRFEFDNSRQKGIQIFKTITIGSVVYLGLWYLNLKRIRSKSSN